VSRHRNDVRPRYARLAAAASSLVVTLIAVLGGTGVLPVSSGLANASAGGQGVLVGAATTGQAAPAPGGANQATNRSPGGTGTGVTPDAEEAKVDPERDATLPADSGTGTRIVFSESRQRVWLVTGDEEVQRTYRVSGSLYDNLDAGTFSVYSRSEQAWGIDDSGSMRYFVRFTQGDNGAAIGFHDIPVKDGALVQTEAQLGTPTSHGCIRQRRPDAIALWKFAPLGTTVVVTA
jgi:lipoprotein-anchoring transpeptidase ErfK/SrfK